MIKVNPIGSANSENLVPTSFPDGTKLLKFDRFPHDNMTITWLYDNDEELFQLIALTKHLRNRGVKRIELDLPYVPNARMDRTKATEEVFTLKAFADTINWLGFDKVSIVNPHSTVSEALFDRLYVNWSAVAEDIYNIIYRILPQEIDAIYFPDEGACKRFSGLVEAFGLPIVYGEKKRDWETGKILGIEVHGGEDLGGKNVLVIDDIISYGGSIYYSALKLKELGVVEIRAYATHVEKSVLDPEKGKLINAEWKDKTNLIEAIYTTNSIYRGVKNEKIKVIREF